MGMGTLLLPVYLLLFEMPHIIASLVTFADRSYLDFYKNYLRIGIPIIVLLVVVIALINPLAVFLIYVIATAYHAIRQQTGIASLLAKRKGLAFQVWSWIMILGMAIAWLLLSAPQFFNQKEILLYSILVFGCVVLSGLSGAWYWYHAKTKIGRWYIFATTAMVLAAYFFIQVGYIFFAFFIIRFIHDITAFTFYIVHDQNRNEGTIQNNFYALFKKLRLPFLILVPLVAISIALLLRMSVGDTMVATTILATFGFIHYYLESIMWKRESAHRQHISFTPSQG